MSNSSGWRRNAWLLAASVTMIGVCFALDERVNDWLSEHPLMSNIIAGLPAIPLGVVIVSFFVERSIEREQRRERQRVRDHTLARIGAAWGELRELFVLRFSLDDLMAFRGEIVRIEEVWRKLAQYEDDYILMVRSRADYPPPAITVPSGTAEIHSALTQRWFKMHPAGVLAKQQGLEDRILTTLIPRLDWVDEDTSLAIDMRNFSDSLTATREALDVFVEWVDPLNVQLSFPPAANVSWDLVSAAPATLQALSNLRTLLQAAEAALTAGDRLFTSSQQLTSPSSVGQHIH